LRLPPSSEKILALVQAHPEWKGIQVLQESRCLAPDRAVFASIETRIHGLSTLRPPGRSTWEESWPSELIQGGHSEVAVSVADQCAAQVQPLPTPVPGRPSSTAGEYEASHLALTTLEQAITAYVQEMRVSGRDPKTLQWHQTSLGALRRYLWRQFHLTDVGSLTGTCLQAWVSDLPLALSIRTGVTRTVSTVAACAPSATG
jgi:hypothetical protein